MLDNTQPLFGIIGAGGYVAPKHVKAIQENNGKVVAACDLSDSMGYLDSIDYDIEFFTNSIDFFDYMESLYGTKYISICSPNHFHFHHAYLGLAAGCNVICEKPIVIHSEDLKRLIESENTLTPNRVFPILQLRELRTIKALKKTIDPGKHYDIMVTYITPRGLWYRKSWKSDKAKSGGVLMNIGIHLFDLLCFLFGKPEESAVHFKSDLSAAGSILFKNATAQFCLSVDPELFYKVNDSDEIPVREFNINSDIIDLSDQPEDLHSLNYKKILSGKGYSIEEGNEAIELVSKLNSCKWELEKEKIIHPLAKDLC